MTFSGHSARSLDEHSLLPPPLWGRVGEGGKLHAWRLLLTPSLSLPHKGGENAGVARSGNCGTNNDR